MANHTRKTIEYAYANPRAGTPEGGYNVYGHGVYESSSVLAGQASRSFLCHRDTIDECKALHPDAEVIEGSSRVHVYLPATPPPWFDPADAGEEW